MLLINSSTNILSEIEFLEGGRAYFGWTATTGASVSEIFIRDMKNIGKLSISQFLSSFHLGYFNNNCCLLEIVAANTVSPTNVSFGMVVNIGGGYYRFVEH
jgi:hypothetical protein